MTEEADKLMAMLSRTCDGLMEHFDAIQIVASTRNQDGTALFHSGKGNYYARRGMVQEWIIHETEASCCEVREERR